MENYPFDTVGLNSDTIDLYNDTYKALKADLDLQLTGNIDFQLDQFEVFRGYDGVNLRGSFAIKQDCNNDFYVLFVETTRIVNTRYGRDKRTDYQTWAVAYLKNDFDRVLIRRETLADKLIELVHPVELDFEDDKAFSDTFYVLVNDRNKAIRGITRNFRNVVMDTRHDNLLIEIMGHTLIAGSYVTMMPGTAVNLAEFAGRLCKLC
jgi:hypothetical protein